MAQKSLTRIFGIVLATLVVLHDHDLGGFPKT
jgi:hypothetical protein